MGDETLVSRGEEEKYSFKKSRTFLTGDVLHLGTSYGVTSVVGGRNPATKDTNIAIPKDCLAAMLGGTTEDDTSRQQFLFTRDEKGEFYIKNISRNISIHTKSSLKGKQPLGPGRQVRIGNSITNLNGLEIYWDKFQLIQSGSLSETSEGGWDMNFTFSVSTGKS
jgi:hypothetical protein